MHGCVRPPILTPCTKQGRPDREQAGSGMDREDIMKKSRSREFTGMLVAFAVLLLLAGCESFCKTHCRNVVCRTPTGPEHAVFIGPPIVTSLKHLQEERHEEYKWLSDQLKASDGLGNPVFKATRDQRLATQFEGHAGFVPGSLRRKSPGSQEGRRAIPPPMGKNQYRRRKAKSGRKCWKTCWTR